MSVIDPHEYDPKIQNLIIYKSLIYVSEIYRSSGDYDKCLDCLNKCRGLSETNDEHFHMLADIYLNKGMKPELLEVTTLLIKKNPQDKNVKSLHNLACMLNNIQSVI